MTITFFLFPHLQGERKKRQADSTTNRRTSSEGELGRKTCVGGEGGEEIIRQKGSTKNLPEGEKGSTINFQLAAWGTQRTFPLLPGRGGKRGTGKKRLLSHRFSLFRRGEEMRLPQVFRQADRQETGVCVEPGCQREEREGGEKE